MKVYYWVALALLAYLLLVLPWQRRRQVSVFHHIQKRKREAASMEALARQFLHKECIIYTVTDTSGTVQGPVA